MNLIPTTEVAQRLKISRATVARLAGRGDLATAAKGPGRTGPLLFDAVVVEEFARKRESAR